MVGNITSANASVVMVVDNLFPAGVTLEQFGTDQAFSQEQSQTSETRMGVDGRMVAGWIPTIKVVTITLEASSPSFAYMSQLYRAMDKGRTIFPVTIVARIPSIDQTITWSNGVLHDATPVPTAGNVLEATTWVFHFQDMVVERNAL